MFDMKEFTKLAEKLNGLEEAVVTLKASDVKVPKALKKDTQKTYEKAFDSMAEALKEGVSRQELAERIMGIIQG